MAGRGRPDKQQMLKNKEARMKKDLVEKVLRGKSLAVEHYDKYIEALNDYALGNIKDASVTNRISCIKYMLEYCDKIMQEEAKKGNSEPETEKPAEPQAKANGTTGEVISLISTNYDDED